MDGPGSVSERPADLELARVSLAPDGAFGVLLIDGVPAGPVTLERTYPVDPAQPRGAQYVKIPPGRYLCRRTRFNRGGYDTYEITGVVGHERLLWHVLNVETESEGCIGVGLRFGYLSGRPAILESAPGFARFMAFVGGRPSFWLRVVGPAA